MGSGRHGHGHEEVIGPKDRRRAPIDQSLPAGIERFADSQKPCRLIVSRQDDLAGDVAAYADLSDTRRQSLARGWSLDDDVVPLRCQVEHQSRQSVRLIRNGAGLGGEIETWTSPGNLPRR